MRNLSTEFRRSLKESSIEMQQSLLCTCNIDSTAIFSVTLWFNWRTVYLQDLVFTLSGMSISRSIFSRATILGLIHRTCPHEWQRPYVKFLPSSYSSRHYKQHRWTFWSTKQEGFIATGAAFFLHLLLVSQNFPLGWKETETDASCFVYARVSMGVWVKPWLWHIWKTLG